MIRVGREEPLDFERNPFFYGALQSNLVGLNMKVFEVLAALAYEIFC